jgi:hypothetical protein
VGRVDSEITSAYKAARFQTADHEQKCVALKRKHAVQVLNNLNYVRTLSFASKWTEVLWKRRQHDGVWLN